MSNLVQELQRTYDDQPYQSYCFRHSSPEHLATIAHLFGLGTPAVESARVLELGCASGGNLIPFAVRHPHAKVMGIDLSSVQVAEGQRRITALGLTNIELCQADLSSLGSDLGEFDYIICHGVYSWVPEHVRSAILRICKENLAKDGVAYVSYNTYPGWKGQEILRDAMRLRADRFEGSALQKLAYGRGMVEFLQQWANPQSVLGAVVERHAPALREHADYYLIHEYLEPCNAPCYFAEFVARAEQQGLGYLAEAEPTSMFLQNYAAEVQQPLINECGHSQVVLEQYLDFLNNRPFRQTLLVHTERVGQVKYQIQPERLKSLSMAAHLICTDGEIDLAGGEQHFITPGGSTLGLRSPAEKIAARSLTEAWPCTLTVDALLNLVRDELGEVPDGAQQHILELFEHLVIKGLGRYRLLPVERAAGAKKKPKVDRSAIAYVTLGSEGQQLSTFNPWHEPVMLDAAAAFLLPLLDGKHTQNELLKALVEEVKAGRLHFFRDGAPVTDAAGLRTVIPQHLQWVLGQMAA